MKEELVELICEALIELNEDMFEQPALTNPKAKTYLFGPKGQLDSQGLVALIVAVEDKVEERYGQEVTIADERAMSQKISPFIRVDRLAAYVEKLIQEAGDG